MVPLASKLTVLTALPKAIRRDLGRWSPWGRLLYYRRRYDAVIASLIRQVRSDPNLHDRNDVLSMLLEARDEEGRSLFLERTRPPKSPSE